jgi:hypothetical protein
MDGRYGITTVGRIRNLLTFLSRSQIAHSRRRAVQAVSLMRVPNFRHCEEGGGRLEQRTVWGRPRLPWEDRSPIPAATRYEEGFSALPLTRPLRTQTSQGRPLALYTGSSILPPL